MLDQWSTNKPNAPTVNWAVIATPEPVNTYIQVPGWHFLTRDFLKEDYPIKIR